MICLGDFLVSDTYRGCIPHTVAADNLRSPGTIHGPKLFKSRDLVVSFYLMGGVKIIEAMGQNVIPSTIPVIGYQFSNPGFATISCFDPGLDSRQPAVHTDDDSVLHLGCSHNPVIVDIDALYLAIRWIALRDVVVALVRPVELRDELF
jgi:hypothetical protein